MIFFRTCIEILTPVIYVIKAPNSLQHTDVHVLSYWWTISGIISWELVVGSLTFFFGFGLWQDRYWLGNVSGYILCWWQLGRRTWHLHHQLLKLSSSLLLTNTNFTQRVVDNFTQRVFDNFNHRVFVNFTQRVFDNFTQRVFDNRCSTYLFSLYFREYGRRFVWNLFMEW